MMLLIGFAAALCGGCAGRFSTQTDYLAPGFTRESLRGRTVALVPPPGHADAFRNEVAGIALGMSEFGARVTVLPAGQNAAAAEGPLDTDQTVADGGAGFDTLPPPDATPPPGGAPATYPGLRGSRSYVLLVEVTDALVYRAYAVPRDRGGAGRAAAASRTSGRRVGLRMTLLRPADGAAEWIAGGEGELSRSRTAAAPGAAPAAANVDDDLGGGNLPLYPPLPRADTLTRRLTRRLLAHVPSMPPLQPN